MTNRRRICVVTGSRAEYGHLFWLLKSLNADRAIKAQLVVTGMHLSRDFGSTYKVIEADGFSIDYKVPILNKDNSALSISKAVSTAIEGMSKAFNQLKPHLVVICGDRYESFAAACAAHLLNIPIAHLHGGETSQGAIDEALRHSITKMSLIHFAATEEYRQRIIQLGEHPNRVYNFGAPGLDHLAYLKPISFESFQQMIGISLVHPWAIATIHPVTLNQDSDEYVVKNMIEALKKLKVQVVFTKANADAGGIKINQILSKECQLNPKQFILKDNLGSQLYYQCLSHADVMVGNSSSGLTEAPSFRLPVVDIGDRQRGRMKAGNIIHVSTSTGAIRQGIQQALSTEFRSGLRRLKNPYAGAGIGKISMAVKDKLKRIDLHQNVLMKSFYDLKG